MYHETVEYKDLETENETDGTCCLEGFNILSEIYTIVHSGSHSRNVEFSNKQQRQTVKTNSKDKQQSQTAKTNSKDKQQRQVAKTGS